MPSRPRSLRVFGFPLTIRAGFVLGMLLIYQANGPRYGPWLVAWLAVLTLAHELGHAFAARRFEADAAISLNFLVGFASLRPRRPLTRGERAIISASGPLVEIALGVAVLLILGANPFDHGALVGDPLRLAVWWAGPVLGLVNLLPVNPLDGGNLAGLALDPLSGGRGRLIVSCWSLAAAVCGLLFIVTHTRWVGLSLVVGFVGFISGAEILGHLRQRFGHRPASATAPRRGAATGASAVRVAVNSEREAWDRRRPGIFPPGWNPSPWFSAALARAAHDDERARAVLVDSLTHGGGTWVSPEGATTDELGALADLLPQEPPIGDLHAGFVLVSVLHQVGQLRRAAEYGRRLYAVFPAPVLAAAVARSLALMGRADDAMGWLKLAVADDPTGGALEHPDLESLRTRADYAELCARISVGPSDPMSAERGGDRTWG